MNQMQNQLFGKSCRHLNKTDYLIFAFHNSQFAVYRIFLRLFLKKPVIISIHRIINKLHNFHIFGKNIAYIENQNNKNHDKRSYKNKHNIIMPHHYIICRNHYAFHWYKVPVTVGIIFRKIYLNIPFAETVQFPCIITVRL